MGLKWNKENKDRHTASSGEHHYVVDGDYYNGWEVFYATGETPPPQGSCWKIVDSDNSTGKAIRSAGRHFRKIKDAA